MSERSTVSKHFDASHGTFRSYLSGFVLSLYLTVTAYVITVNHLFTTGIILAAVVGLAILQLLVQLIFFLHLSHESKPRWNLTAFLFMVMVVVILVFGTLWIMNNLNYHALKTHGSDRYIIQDEGVHR